MHTRRAVKNVIAIISTIVLDQKACYDAERNRLEIPRFIVLNSMVTSCVLTSNCYCVAASLLYMERHIQINIMMQRWSGLNDAASAAVDLLPWQPLIRDLFI